MEILLNEAIVRKVLDKNLESTNLDARKTKQSTGVQQVSQFHITRIIRPVSRYFGSFRFREPNPFRSQLLQTSEALNQITVQPPQNIDITKSPGGVLEAHENQWAGMKISAVQREAALALHRKAVAQHEYLLKHPYYDRSLFIFGHDSQFRQFCRMLVRSEQVGPQVGSELRYRYSNSFLTFDGIIALVTLSTLATLCIATPSYNDIHTAHRSQNPWSWIICINLTAAVLFSCEAIVRIIADGFLSAPNAYCMSLWGIIDVIVLVSTWVMFGVYRSSGQIPAIGALIALKVFRIFKFTKSLRISIQSIMGNISGLLMVMHKFLGNEVLS
jgi:hypothetical protein